MASNIEYESDSEIDELICCFNDTSPIPDHNFDQNGSNIESAHSLNCSITHSQASSSHDSGLTDQDSNANDSGEGEKALSNSDENLSFNVISHGSSIPSSTIHDKLFSGPYGFSECSNGDRSYLVENSQVILTNKGIEELKGMSKAVNLDSIFVSTMLTQLFSNDVLKISSAKGRKSNFNKKSHAPLDRSKLQFVEDLFAHRIKYDGSRKKHFTKFVNEKCNNLRRK